MSRRWAATLARSSSRFRNERSAFEAPELDEVEGCAVVAHTVLEGLRDHDRHARRGPGRGQDRRGVRARKQGADTDGRDETPHGERHAATSPRQVAKPPIPLDLSPFRNKPAPSCHNCREY